METKRVVHPKLNKHGQRHRDYQQIWMLYSLDQTIEGFAPFTTGIGVDSNPNRQRTQKPKGNNCSKEATVQGIR